MRLLTTLAVSLAIACLAAGPSDQSSKSVSLAKSGSSGPTKHTIVIENLKYKPDSIEIAPGDTVVWVNRDDRDHMVKAEDGTFESTRMASGKSYEFKFDKPGKYRYGDDLSPRMHGTIIVKAK